MKDSTNDLRWLSDIPNAKALLVVAHSDDETIFAGGLILTSRNTQWTVVCCFPESSERRDEFRRACGFLAKESGNRIRPIVLTCGQKTEQELGRMIRERVCAKDYDIVFTHNSEGEYQGKYIDALTRADKQPHFKVHRSVINFVAHPNTWLFISPGSCNVDQDKLKSKRHGGNQPVPLSPEIQKLKIRAFQECHVSQARCYGYDPVSGKLRESQLRDTLLWEFEEGREEFTFFK